MLRCPTSARNFASRASNLNLSSIQLQTGSHLESVTSLIGHRAPMTAYSPTVSTSVEQLPVPDDGALKIHHVVKNGKLIRFKNPYPSWGDGASPWKMLKLVIWLRFKGKLKSPDTSPPTVPVIKPWFLPTRTASNKLRATWLGHACCYVEFPSGLRALFDPVFEDRCSPFARLGPKRYTEKPCDIADILVVDACFISHAHYDHLSKGSVLEVKKHHPNAHFFVGKGLAPWFQQAGIRAVTELDWWESVAFDLEAETPAADGGSPGVITTSITCTPSQHTSGRTPFDKDTTLWCSWAVRSGGKSVWFGGDTGYRQVPYLPENVDDYEDKSVADLPRCPQFKQIGDAFKKFDLGLIPVGAYYPRAAFSAMHANPFDSVEIFQDTGCEKAVGIHWGTWALTMEEVLDPPRQLKLALKRKSIPETGVFDVLNIGESREY